MDYRFTALLILMLTMLAFFAEPAYPKNEYLQQYDERCGEVDMRVEQRDQDYNYSTSTNEQSNFSITYKKYLGVDCKSGKENRMLRQQLELMKMCGRVNSNPSLALNKNFDLLTSKCRGVTPTKVDNRPDDSGSAWDDLKDDYKKENPEITLMGDKFLKKKKLIIPKYLTDEKIILPMPKP